MDALVLEPVPLSSTIRWRTLFLLSPRPLHLFTNPMLSFSLLFLIALFSSEHASGDAELSSVASFSAEDLHSPERIASVFDSWLNLFPRSYSFDVQERQRRLQIFSDNLLYVHLHNLKNVSYKLGLTKFADLSNQEFRAVYFGSSPMQKRALLSQHPSQVASPRLVYGSDDAFPSSVDWRAAGSVTRVKDQGSCGLIATRN